MAPLSEAGIKRFVIRSALREKTFVWMSGRRIVTSRHCHPDGFLDDVERPLLYLLVNAADVFSKDAEQEELNRPENADGRHDRGPPRHQGVVENKVTIEHVKDIADEDGEEEQGEY